MTLMLHSGAAPIEYAALAELPTPDATATHVPVPHHDVVNMVKYSLGYFGHELVEEHYGVTEDGMRFFGLLSLRSTYGDYTDTVGLRNSHDKRFPIGIAMGSRVFVCDNLAFHSEHVVTRKHTAKAKYALPSLIAEIVSPLRDHRQAQARTFDRYKATPLLEHQVDQAIMRLYRQDVINVTRIAEVLKAYEEPPHNWGDPSAWRLFNAATFALTGRVAENPTVTRKLHDIIDAVVLEAA
jgi:hypothetical protein